MVSRPHGGRLISRVASESRKERILAEASEFQTIKVNLEKAIEIENIAKGVYSPLEGFMLSGDLMTCLSEMRLSSGVPWTMPILLDLREEEVRNISEGDEILLSLHEMPLATMEVEEIYTYDKHELAKAIFGTEDERHPGVRMVKEMGETLVGGRITLLNSVPNPYERYTLWPKETRVLFKEKGWKTVVGFQTRNAPHRGHEAIQKTALAIVDGLFVNPVIGRKKPGDFRDDVILEAYRVLIENYYPRDTAVLAILRYEMRYAGPREAVHHAIMRKNFGCTHFIVGRDHAGVGNFYSPYAAQEIFKNFPDLGITPLFIRESFYCKKCGGMVNEKICPHGSEYRIKISGTKLRDML
ncbi:MAG: sulfate adenylyltransferase, partial [Thermoproteota archaeon]